MGTNFDKEWIRLIYLLAGAAIGFLSARFNKWLDEKQERKRYLGDLLADFKYNLDLAQRRINHGYHTLGYIDAKSAKYLFDLPEGLRTQIYDVQALVSQIYDIQPPDMRASMVSALKGFLEEAIPEFEKFLN